MSYAASTVINTSLASISRARGTLTQALYLKRVSRLLSTEPETILSQLASIRSALVQHSNFRVLVIANIESLPNPVSSWKPLTSGLSNSQPLEPFPNPLSRLSPAGLTPGSSASIIPLPTIDSSFVISVAHGPSSPLDPSIPALMVAIAYLDAVEGPLWTAVRGTGLAYDTSFSRATERGHISFHVYRSPNAFTAFKASKAVVEDFVNGKTEFEPLALEGAISSIVLNIANGQATMAGAAQGSFTNQVFKGLPVNWNDVILEKVRAVGVDEIRSAMKEVVMSAFRAETANLIVTCAPILEEVSFRLSFYVSHFLSKQHPCLLLSEETRIFQFLPSFCTPPSFFPPSTLSLIPPPSSSTPPTKKNLTPSRNSSRASNPSVSTLRSNRSPPSRTITVSRLKKVRRMMMKKMKMKTMMMKKPKAKNK